MTVRVEQRPEQSGRQEPVVEPLIRRQHLGGAREFRRGPKHAAAIRRVPQEHLQHEEVDVQRGDESDENVGDSSHARSLPRPSPCRSDGHPEARK